MMEYEATILWFIAGLVLILLEFVIPGVVIIFFGLGAWMVSIGLWLGLIDSVAAQCMVFSTSSLLMLFVLRRYVSSWFVGGSWNGGSNVDEEFVGKSVRVVHAIGGGDNPGKVELKGAEWVAFADQAMDVGTHATVVKRDGIHLMVE
ncbi:NfeD family protein [Verrucomicrobiaceae bacterium N1E253]|uniref:NfeD family protein n=1 Tax=Oceaniferula marina TaxID=2748318 RepID=A0A851GC97_9BACT|nr:NfeD family protein [Oceaniferula marina]NWK55203.1 NfeD family protein [Oceaniferula marina]